ncbi:hypothetical protein ACS0TY_011264 [Phlomoides rotata]
MEFVVITCLKFGPTTEIPDNSKFFNKVFKGKTSLQVKDVQLAFLKSCKIDKGSRDEALKLALLWVLFGILLVKDKTTKKIDMKFVHLVDNLDDFNNYSWGRLAYDVLVKNMRKHMGPKSVTRRAKKLTTKDKPTLPHIDVHGFAHVLQLWAYEAMPCVASYCATRRSKTSIPRMLRWDASKAFRFDELTQNCFPILKAGDKMSERMKVMENLRLLPWEHGLAGSKRSRDDVTKRRTKRKEEDRVDSKGSIEDEVKQLKKSYKIMEKAMEEIKAAQAIIMRKLKVHDMDEEEDEGEESDEKDENDESEDSAEEADETEEEIGEDQGDEEEQEADGEGQDEQEAADDGEDSDEDDEEDGEDRDDGDEGNEEDGGER